MFDKTEMMEWEQQPINMNQTRQKPLRTQGQGARHVPPEQQQRHSRTQQVKSANNMADIGDEIKDYIVKMASASVTNNDLLVANMCEADKKKDTEMADMAAQIKQLTASIAKLASRGQQNTENDDPNKNRGCRGDRIVEQMTKLRNMGRYCSTHGFHPVGPTHDSVTCQ